MIIAVKELCNQTVTDVRAGRESWRVLGACSMLALVASVAQSLLSAV